MSSSHPCVVLLFSNRRLVFFKNSIVCKSFVGFFKFGVGLRAACFHSDMTKHTGPPYPALLTPVRAPKPSSSPHLSTFPSLSFSVCELWSPSVPLKPDFTPVLPLSPSSSPSPDLPPTLKIKKTIFLCPRKKRFLSSFIL
ncbi:hypothetical protein ILYODFUR_000271 [Ilyodon furcidens]|uniref:Uncharacterized protein n=1 Tax=Ilyodon furcidens TaxID=33524 RepID=A0ABV0V1X2_9TELE